MTDPDDGVDPRRRFHSPHYRAHNRARLEHLASLGLPLEGASVLEVGAGIGDHSGFFLERGCRLTITDGRPDNLAVARARYPEVETRVLDLDAEEPQVGGRFDVVCCYGLLYHLAHPGRALETLASHCDSMMLVETCVFPGQGDFVRMHREPSEVLENAVSGLGCRPTRRWVFRELSRHFEWVYVPKTQPDHPEFPLDWTVAPPNPWLVRSVFVASRRSLDAELLSPRLLDRYEGSR